jgi:3-hydroxyisobutyrate dehydrogenase-like beta-hydroxyacid dehydrogenase
MTTISNDRLGWLGTGRMGIQMIRRLLAADADVTVWNRTAAKCEPLIASGAKLAGCLQDLATADIVFTMVTTSSDLIEVTLGEQGLLHADARPRILVDCSTVSAESSAYVRAEAESRGVQFLAAPISGNPDMVAEGGAALIVSGPADAFDDVRPHLEAIAATVVHCGQAEESRLVKLCHNLLLGTITQALAEVTALAQKGGVANEAFLGFINGSVLGSSFIRHKGAAIAERNYTPTFTAENLRKDYDLGLAAARALEVPMPITASTHQLIQTLIGHGFGQADYAALYELQARAAALANEDHT